MKLVDLRYNPSNPRSITEKKFFKLVDSLIAFPDMLRVRQIAHDDGIVLGANMRLRAINYIVENYDKDDISSKVKKSGHFEIWDKVATSLAIPKEWAVNVKNWSDDEKRQFIIKDNIGYGEWDYEMLSNQWDEVELEDWGLDVTKSKNDNDKDDKEEEFVTEYKVEITCDNETQQEELFNKLMAEGYDVRLLTL